MSSQNSFLTSTADHPNTLYILFAKSPTPSQEQKSHYRQLVNQLNKQYADDENNTRLEIVFGDEVDNDALTPDDLDEEGYIWALQDDEILTEYLLEKPLEEDQKDVDLWIMSQAMTLQHMSMFQGIEMGEEEEEQADDSNQNLAKKILSAQDVDEEDDDEYVPENDADDDDEDDDDDLPEEFDPEKNSAMAMMEQLEQLRNLHLEDDKDIITQKEVQKLWIEYAAQLGRNSLAFTAFKDAMSKFVSELLFIRNPVMKMMNQFTDPRAADQDDLDQLLEEVGVSTFTDRNPQNLPKYPATVTKHKASIQKKYGKSYTDDCEYLVENLVGATDDNDEDAEEKDTAYTPADREWMIAGPEIQRLRVGSFGVSRKWKGQFRCKVSPHALIYYMFDFTPSTIPRSKQAQQYHREFFTSYMQQQLDRFRESRLFKVVMPFDTLHRLQYHESKVEGMLSLTVLQVTEAPQFFVKQVKNLNNVGQWDEIEDFSPEYQFSQYATHYVVGIAREWSATLGSLVQSNKTVAELYSSDVDYDAIEEEQGEDGEVEPNFELDAKLAETEQGEVPFESDVGAGDGGEDDGEDGEEGCVIM